MAIEDDVNNLLMTTKFLVEHIHRSENHAENPKFHPTGFYGQELAEDEMKKGFCNLSPCHDVKFWLY